MTRYLFCATLLFVILTGCPSATPEKCGNLYIDCPGEARDEHFCSDCRLTYERVKDEIRWFKWRYCDSPQEFSWLTGADCELVVK